MKGVHRVHAEQMDEREVKQAQVSGTFKGVLWEEYEMGIYLFSRVKEQPFRWKAER